MFSVPSHAFAQTNASERPTLPPALRPSASPPVLTIYLMTMGPGKRVWERFGHNAIWVHDPMQGTDKAYNYGLFDLRQENFVVRFLQGRMWYWMQGFPAESYVELYRKANRSVWLQELEMPLTAKRQLQEFLEWNERPENRFYHYDYYLDNCSTRIRDALDRALGGPIREQTSSLLTDRTYRFHTRRLTTNDPLVYTGLLLALGQPVDRPISAWEEMFLPLALREHLRNVTVATERGKRPLVRSERTLFLSTDVPPPDRPPLWLPVYLLAGVTTGGVIFILARKARDRRSARVAFSMLVAIWAFVAGIAGLVVAGLWCCTDHTAAYRNENVLQVSVIMLGTLGLVPAMFRRREAGRWALIVTAIVAGLSIVGLLLKALPAFYQVNGEIIALTLPIQMGVAGGIWRLTRS